MTIERKLNANGQQLRSQLAAARDSRVKDNNKQFINVAGVGGVVSAAYEQLRNAAEYAQEHLLIQNAIRRFYMRNLSFHIQADITKTLAEELVIELTQAGYLQNNTQPIEITDKIYKVIKKHYDNFWRLKAVGINDNQVRNWTLDLLALECEDLLRDDYVSATFLQFAYNHYLEIVPKTMFTSNHNEESTFEVSLYVAIHRALLKSGLASVRYDMQKLYKVSSDEINAYAQFHENIDNTFYNDLTNKLVVYINKYGAPLRIFRSLLKDNDKVDELLGNFEKFESAYSAQIKREYSRAESKLNRGLIKSIVFLLITKTLIGVGFEVPYDIFLTGVIAWPPLLVNLFTPVIYMALLRFGFRLPGATNAKALDAYAGEMLYGEKQSNLFPKPKNKRYPIGFTIAYSLLFLIVFGFVSYLLVKLGFNPIQGIMFFTFLGAASFLGFRLSRIVHELELVVVKPGFFMTLRDLFFTPFTFLGKWLSEKYQKVNIIALVLDTFIEMPLKTVLRLLRQWTGFIDEKKDSF